MGSWIIIYCKNSGSVNLTCEYFLSLPTTGSQAIKLGIENLDCSARRNTFNYFREIQNRIRPLNLCLNFQIAFSLKLTQIAYHTHAVTLCYHDDAQLKTPPLAYEVVL